jgi:hypothetical protein
VVDHNFLDAFGRSRKVDAFGIESGFNTNAIYAWVRSAQRMHLLTGLNVVYALMRDNHSLDCRVYNKALAEHLGLSKMSDEDWKGLARDRELPGSGASVGCDGGGRAVAPGGDCG